MKTKIGLENFETEASFDFCESIFSSVCHINEYKLRILIKMLRKLQEKSPRVNEMFKEEFQELDMIEQKESELLKSLDLMEN